MDHVRHAVLERGHRVHVEHREIGADVRSRHRDVESEALQPVGPVVEEEAKTRQRVAVTVGGGAAEAVELILPRSVGGGQVHNPRSQMARVMLAHTPAHVDP